LSDFWLSDAEYDPTIGLLLIHDLMTKQEYSADVACVRISITLFYAKTLAFLVNNGYLGFNIVNSN
jgi:hypothetical protein